MQTILIATDFSAAAQNATNYGFALARTLQAKVILLNSHFYSNVFPDATALVALAESEECSEKQLEAAVEVYDPNRTVKLEMVRSPAPVIDSILQIVKSNTVSYIIAGMKEKGKEMRKVFGSTVTALINESRVPIIVVPEKAPVVIPQKIALSSNLNNEQIIDIVRPLKKLVEQVGSKLYIVTVVDRFMSEPFEVLMKCSKADWFLRSVNPVHEFIQDDKIGEAVISFANKNAVNMIAVIAHPHTLLERIFNSTLSQYFCFHSPIPLLVLPSVAADKQKISAAAAAYCSGNCLVDNGTPKCNKYQQMHYEYEQEVNKETTNKVAG